MAGPETVTASGPVLLHLLYLIFQHTLDLVAHGLLAGLAKMNPHDMSGFWPLSLAKVKSWR